MNENLNLVEILKDCPKGTTLYSIPYGNVRFEKILPHAKRNPIIVRVDKYITESFCADGKMFFGYDGECALFPSRDQRDWSKFTAPWADEHPAKVWHEASEMPKEEEWILIQIDEDSYDALVFCEVNAVAFRTCCKKHCSIRWAYISDLLPKQFGNSKQVKGGEQ